ncbi:MAG TPA: hypothetical protein VMT55_04245, partial [Candidatus Sulfotelmatobacter sp.]|nr:hypothetical protein [Candidatus Sulfotelmatobacter sp.]
MCLFLVTAGTARAEEAIYTKDYYLSFFPNYPPAVGEKVFLKLRTFRLVQQVTIYSDREQKIPMQYHDGFWWGEFRIPDDYQTGSHFFTVWFRRIMFARQGLSPVWFRSTVWYQMAEPSPPTANLVGVALPFIDTSSEESLMIVTGESFSIPAPPSLEALPFVVKGSKTLAFSSKSIEGTKEGFVPGTTREEALRLNITGKSDDAEINATLISTSTLGTAQVAQREDKTSLFVRKGSTEAYLGDFTADLTDTEFTKLNKVLSGIKVKGDYQQWGFNALYSSPKGSAQYKRIYGDGTQGPFKLDLAPVVIDSERVIVNGFPQKRGDDYTIDYNAGTVTFTKKTIDPKSILEFYYDYRQTVYQHATTGLRLTAKPYPNLKLGATYLDDSDSLTGAAEIRASMSQEAVDPASHSVVGVDGSLVSELLTANGEAAYSRQNLNLLGGGSEEAGKAVKLELSTQLGPFGLTARGKRVGANFVPIGDPDPKQDVTEYGAGLSFRSGSLFGLQGDYDADKYTQSGVLYDNYYESARASLTPDRLPSLDYSISENKESNDPVTGSTIDRKITRNSAETLMRLGFLSASLKGTTEKWLEHVPSEEVTDYKRVNFGLSTLGLEKVTFTSNVGLEDRVEPDGSTPHRR